MPGLSWDEAERPSRAWAGLCLPAPPALRCMCCLRPRLPCAGCPTLLPAGSGAAALLTLLLLGDSFFLPGNPPGQTKKALKQRFLKLLPCCRPKSIPSLSESKCFFLPLCVCVPAVLLPALRPGPARGKGMPPLLLCPWFGAVRISSALERSKPMGSAPTSVLACFQACFPPLQLLGAAPTGCMVVRPALELAQGGETLLVLVEGLGGC